VGFTTIPGTEGSISPCFAPDGKQIAFWRNGAFVVMPVAGGQQVVIDDSLDVPESCSWGEDGYIYRQLSPRGVFEIIRMRPAANAVQTVVARADTAETSFALPEALPNGKAVLFQLLSRNGKTAIVAADVATGHRTVVMPDGVRARYALNGQLLYTTSDGKLWSIAFDQASLKVSGEPSAVGEGIPTTMVGPTDFAVSASGTLAYAVDYTSTLAELLMVSRSGVEVPVDSAWRGRFASPALSRDGSQLAVSMNNGKGSDIWIKRTSGGSPQKFTLERGNNTEPEFTPDGRSLSFINGGLGTSRWLNLLVQPLEGGGKATRVLESDRSISEHTWSPAGHMVAVRTTTSDVGAGDILAGSVNASPMTMTPIVASSRSEYSPTISPDGRFMAYASNESGRFEVYVVPFPNPGTAKWQVTTTGGRAPRWARRGGEIFYIDLSSNLVSAAVTTSPAFAVQSRTVLFNAAAYSILAISRHSFDVMPDDQHFLMVRRRGGSSSAQMVVVENWFDELRATRTGKRP
jgi:serine/threonine-protein kinase